MEVMEAALEGENLFSLFVLFMEGKMDRILGISPFEMDNNHGNDSLSPTSPEVGEETSPSQALLFKGGSVSMISGRSSHLASNGFKPYEDTHFTTQFAIAITKSLATFHAFLRTKGKRVLESMSENEEEAKRCECVERNMSMELASPQSYINLTKTCQHAQDIWTHKISRSSLVLANLDIMYKNFECKNVSSRITRKLEAIQQDISIFTQFLQFASAIQTDSRLQSVGPICMCDVWVPISFNEEEHEEEGDTLVIRIRGGSHMQAPPLRDVSWIWLTLLHPQILNERYMELCESYRSAFNEGLIRAGNDTRIEELTIFDIVRDLGDSFLHGFLTIVHKFTLSGVWSLDRQLHTSEGIHSIAESIGFLIDNGIIGSFFIV